MIFCQWTVFISILLSTKNQTLKSFFLLKQELLSSCRNWFAHSSNIWKINSIFLSMNESIYQVFLVLKMGSKVLEINSIVPSIKRSFFYLDPLKLCRNSYILLELTRNSRILQILLEPSSLASERLFLKNSRSFLIF